MRLLRFIFFIDGALLIILAAFMTIPLVADLLGGHEDWRAFAMSCGTTLFLGAMLMLTCAGEREDINARTGYLLTCSAWLVVSFFGSLPFQLSYLHLSLTDAVFEAVSGVTTTGSTILVGLDDMPAGLLLWRSLLQWIGGVGIVVMAILLLPILRTGGMQLFRTESSDNSGKPVAGVINMAGQTVAAYTVLTIACTTGFAMAGMGGFDAINHAMATLATGGFSTKDASLGYFDSPAIEAVAIVFMTAGALPLIWFASLFYNRPAAQIHQAQIVTFLGVLATAIALMTVWNVHANHMAPLASLRTSAFNVTSVLTDCGFATTDFSTWGSFAMGLFFTLFLIGGCAGSTSGAIKIFRWQILFVGMLRQLKRAPFPHRVFPSRFAGRDVAEEAAQAVRNFFFMYIMTLGALSLAMMATGLDFVSSASAVAQAMANAGPGLGPIVGPGTNFASIPTSGKWLLDLAMLLGRLELTTVYVLLLPDYWAT